MISIPFKGQDIRILNKLASGNEEMGPELFHSLGVESCHKIMVFLFKNFL